MEIEKELTIKLNSSEVNLLWNILLFLKESNKYESLVNSEKHLLNVLLTETSQSEKVEKDDNEKSTEL